MPRRTRDRRRGRERARELERYLPHLSDGYKARDESTIWCGGLAVVGIDSKEELAEVFQSFGDVVHVHIQEATKFAFVHFADEASALAAVGAELVCIRGHEIQVKAASKSSPEEIEQEEAAQAGGEEASDVEAPELDDLPKEMCGDFRAGKCKRGDNCKYSHGDGTEAPQLETQLHADLRKRKDKMCRDFKSGSCLRDKCKFSHGDIDNHGSEVVVDENAEGENAEAGEDMDASNAEEAGARNEDDLPADLVEAELNIQALRVACIHSLESLGKPEMLHELGMDKFIQEHKRQLPSLSFGEFVRAFPENFGVEDQGNGRFLITLLSSDYDDIDMATVENLVEKASIGKSRRTDRKEKAMAAKKEVKDSRRERADRFKTRQSEKGANFHGGKGAPGDSRAVVPSMLSDGWRPRTDRTVWVGNLPGSIRSKHDVANCFQSQFGPVNHIHVTDDRAWGFVHFDDLRDAQRAVDVGFVDMFGRRVDVKRADGSGFGGPGGGGGGDAAASGDRRHGRNGIRVPDLPHRSGARPGPPPAGLPRGPDMYRRDPLPPPQYPPHGGGGGGTYYAAGPPPPQPRPAQLPPQQQSRRPTMDSMQRRPAFRGQGGPPKPAAAFPASASRAAPRPSVAPHLAGRDDAKRRRVA